MSPKIRVGYVSSHPIQYYAPLFRRLAQCDALEFESLFCSKAGLEPTFDPGFQRTIRFDVPLVEGIPHRFLTNHSPRPRLGGVGLLNLEIAKLASSGEYDALIFHGYSSATNLLGLASGQLSRTRLLMRGDSNALATRHRPLKTRALKRLLLPMLLGGFDHFLAVGASNRAYYRFYGVPDDRITIAPFSVDNAHFSQSMPVGRTKLRAKLGLPENSTIVLFVAKLMALKRPLDVIEALKRAQARQVYKPLHLVIVGGGALQAQVERAIAENSLGAHVTLAGFKNQTELPDYYAAADVLVLPSEQESWGLVVNEAMAAGAAIITSDAVGCSLDLVNGNGKTFPVGDVQKLSDALVEMAADPALLKTLQKRSVELIQSFSLDKTVSGFLEGIERALKQPKAIRG